MSEKKSNVGSRNTKYKKLGAFWENANFLSKINIKKVVHLSPEETFLL